MIRKTKVRIILKARAGRTWTALVRMYNSVERCIYHLGRQGVEFNEDSITYNDKGAPKFVYLQGEYGGFEIHLVNK